MRKEIFIAIFAGLTIGIILAFGVWRINSRNRASFNESVVQQTELKTKDETKSLASLDTNLSLTNIEDGTIYFDSPIVISGISNKESIFVISDETDDFIVKASQDGTFEQSIKLVKGINKIVISSIDVNGNTVAEKTFLVVFYPDFKSDVITN